MNTNRTPVVKTGLAALALTMSLGLAACGSDDSSTAADTTDETTSAAPAEETSPAEETTEAAMGAADQVFGPACDQVPADGDGSFDGMATAPVASAASANPLLSTLVTAVTKAGLVDTLNSAEGITVFAPVNDAFAAIPPKTLKAVLKDKPTLTKILTHHVIAGQLSPDQLAGDARDPGRRHADRHRLRRGLQIGAENATVLCGNVPTANATVYIIDTVLMPDVCRPASHIHADGAVRESPGGPQRKDRAGGPTPATSSRRGEPAAAPRARPADLGELLRLSARGDEEAFAQLYDATSARVYGLAAPGRPRPGPGPGGHPGGVPRDRGGPPAGSTPPRAAPSPG